MRTVDHLLSMTKTLKLNSAVIRLVAAILFSISFAVCSSHLVFAQDVIYVDDDQYVDVDPLSRQGTGRRTIIPDVVGASWDQNDQIATGLLNYGLSESIYYQYSGESIFKDGNPLDGTLFTNWNWTRFNKLDLQIPAAWSYGGELLYFSATSKSVYSGKKSTTGSSINMNLTMASFALKAFFLDPVNKFLHPYFGVGWGVLSGSFKGKQNETGNSIDTSFSGVLNYQLLGAQILLGKRAGLVAEIKTMRATASTSDDPFNQGKDNSVDLMFDGVIIGLTGFYRF